MYLHHCYLNRRLKSTVVNGVSLKTLNYDNIILHVYFYELRMSRTTLAVLVSTVRPINIY